MDYVAKSRREYVQWLQRNNPALYQMGVRAARSNMGATDGESDSWLGKIFDGVTSLATGIYGNKLQTEADKRALEQITLQNKAQAIEAQKQAITAIERQQYAQQVEALQRQQIEAQRAQQDTVLMIGGFVLAALVGAKLLKVI